MMYASKEAAEQAVIDGKGDEYDTQLCIGLQAEILSSSPLPQEMEMIASDVEDSIVAKQLQLPTTPPPQSALQRSPLHEDAASQREPPQIGKSRPQEEPKLTAKGEVPSTGEQDTTNLATMEELTQQSSLSLTQENGASAYERFHAAFETPSKPPAAIHETQPKTLPSTKTESTMHTYLEDDTGHINFDDLASNSHPPAEEELVSQDAPYVPPTQLQPVARSFEPQTPAQPVNPFANKGSLMRSGDMFKQTQPSSFGRHRTSPASSRPSPEFYRNRRPSPQSMYARSSPDVENKSSPIRELLCPTSTDSPILPTMFPAIHHTTFRAGGVKSFDSELLSTTIPEPRKYVSMKESQERRRRGSSVAQDSDNDDGDDSDIEDAQRKRQRRLLREKDITKELATIELHPQKSTSNSSRLGPPSSELIEVPSTRRRHSLPEDHIAQCTGIDSRDTQQDDTVVDSQNGSRDSAIPQLATPTKGSDSPDKSLSSPDLPALVHTCLENVLGRNTAISTTPSPAPCSETPRSDLEIYKLPLQELSSNYHNSRTPILSKAETLSDGADATVPETSPIEAKLRPMNEIASLSFGADDEDAMRNLPGFTQDTEFETAMQLGRADFESSKLINAARSPEPAGAHIPSSELTPLSSSAFGSSGRDIASNTPHLQYSTPVAFVTAQSPTPRPRSPLLQAPTRQSTRKVVPTEKQALISAFAKVKTKAVPKPEALRPSSPKPNVNAVMRKQTPVRAPDASEEVSEVELAPAIGVANRTSKRKSALTRTVDQMIEPLSRSSRRRSTQLGRDSSEDPLASTVPLVSVLPKCKKGGGTLFKDMAFAVSYTKQQYEKDQVTSLIVEHGGRILEDGFATFFLSGSVSNSRVKSTDNGPAELVLTPAAKSIGFVALIADEYSRKTKYMEALALGLPCVSGMWITTCILKASLIDWSPYLLCAGQSSFLGNAVKSRILRLYPAGDAKFMGTFAARDRLLDGKSLLVITSRIAEDRRKPYIFLARAMAPSRLGHASDNLDARKKLLEAEQQGQAWDLLYVDGNEKVAETAIFVSRSTNEGSKKRKRGPTPAEQNGSLPKKIRIITDEVVIQSLILGQLLDA